MTPFNHSLEKLYQWYKINQRTLPWREKNTPYRVWISEIMLQQTRMETVLPYFERFTARFPNPRLLGQAPIDEVLSYWSGLGYYNRAKNLRKTAKIISQKGEFPKNRKELEELPGIGPYTAGAILSIAYNQPEAILDGNIERLLSRLREIKRKPNYKKKLWKWSRIFVNTAHEKQFPVSQINQALMEIGALICRPGTPLCGNCPLIDICKAFRNNTASYFPEKNKKSKPVLLQETAHLIINNKNEFILSKEEKKWRKGLWDLPDTIPIKIKKSLSSLGRESIEYTVTKHKIKRDIHIWLSNGDKTDSSWFSQEHIFERKIPYGSSLKKSLLQTQNYIKPEESKK